MGTGGVKGEVEFSWHPSPPIGALLSPLSCLFISTHSDASLTPRTSVLPLVPSFLKNSWSKSRRPKTAPFVHLFSLSHYRPEALSINITCISNAPVLQSLHPPHSQTLFLHFQFLENGVPQSPAPQAPHPKLRAPFSVNVITLLESKPSTWSQAGGPFLSQHTN